MDIERIDFEEVQDDLIELATIDVIINRFVQTYSYYKKTENDQFGFDKTPSESEVLESLEELIDLIRLDIKNGEHTTEIHIFNLETKFGKLLFLKEELLKELCCIICIIYGDSSTEDHVNEEIERDLLKISINDQEGFLDNVYNNVVTKKNLMKLVTATLFLSHFMDDDKMENIDYDIIVETTPKLIKTIFETNVLIQNEFNNNQPITDDFEEVTENNVRDFISFMVGEIRKTNTDFCQELTSGLIAIGRTNK
jgi:hypothetical protein